MPKRLPSIMKIRRPRGGARDRPTVATGVYPYSWSTSGFRQRRAPTPIELIAAWREAVFICSSINAQAVASVPFHLYQTSRNKKGVTRLYPTKSVSQAKVKELLGHSAMGRKIAAAENVIEITNHPVLDLFEFVNPWMDKFGLLELTVLYLQVVGSAYWTFAHGAFNRIMEIWPLPAWMVQPVPDTTGTDVIKEYVYTAMGGQAALERDEVLYFRSTNLFDPYVMGFGNLRAGWLFADTFSKIQDYQDSLLENRARPDAMLIPKEDIISLEEIQRYNLEFRQQFGLSGAGGVYIAPGGMDLKPLSWSPRDMGEMVEAKQALHNVARTFKVPVALIDNEAANRANMDAALLQHARQAVLPLCRYLEETINSNLINRFADDLVFAFDNPVPADRAQDREDAKAFVGAGIWARNEVRADQGKPPVDGGDVLLVPSTLVPLDHAINPPDPRIIMPGGPAKPDELPDDTETPSRPFSEGATETTETEDEPFQEGDDVESEKPAGGSGRTGKAAKGDEQRRPFDIPSAERLLFDAMDDLGYEPDEHADGTLEPDERLRVLHQLRVNACAWFRRNATAALADMGGEYLSKGLVGDAAKKAKAFFARARKFIKNLIIAGVAALGGPKAADAQDMPAIDAQVAIQYGFLQTFEQEVMAESATLDGTFVSRAEMYGASVWGAAQEVKRSRAGSMGLPYERRVHSGPDTPCQDCIDQLDLGWVDIGTLRPIGDSICLTRCHCRFLFGNDLEADEGFDIDPWNM